MRLAALFATLLGATFLLPACPDRRKEPEWQKPPKAWDPTSDEFTFGKKGLDAFNSMSSAERESFTEQLKQSPTFKGQAVFQGGAELGAAMDDAVHGKYEIVAAVPDPVLYEINVAYRLYMDPSLAQGIPPHAHLQFTGTLADLQYQETAKPRKLDLKVKVTELKVLSNRPGASAE